MNASAKLTSAPALGVAIGWWIDSKKGSAPWGVLIGAMIGMTLGFVGFITDVLRMTKKSDAKKDAEKK